MFRFPDRFLFGCATSATQIEGGCRTIDWWQFAHEPGRIAHSDVPDVACDHWNRVAEDTALLTRLGVGAHRLSIEWGRIEPEPGRFDDDALEHYRAELLALVNAGIEPMLTLYHFSLPSWLAARGGVLSREFPERFATFTRRAVRALGDRVKLWVTINEPNVLVAQGYLLGLWPPGMRDPRVVPRAIWNLRRAHIAAYRAIHELAPHAAVGLAHHIRVATPASRSLFDRAAAGALDLTFNDLGWELYPAGLGEVLRRLAKRGKPIWITENGIADAADTRRAAFITAHLAQVARALEDGIDVRGYLHWSLLDNFEWADGYAPRFGLYAVDYATQARTLRPSGELYGRIVKNRDLE